MSEEHQIELSKAVMNESFHIAWKLGFETGKKIGYEDAMKEVSPKVMEPQELISEIAKETTNERE